MDSSVIRAHQDASGGLLGPKNAIGRSQKGFSSKMYLAVNQKGESIQVVISPGQIHDSVGAPHLISRLTSDIVIADKAYDSKAVVAALNKRSIEAVIPCL